MQERKLDVGWPRNPVAFLAPVDPERAVARLHEQIDWRPVAANTL